MRRISTGKIGGPILGDFSVANNIFTSLNANDDINLAPNGTGEVNVSSGINLEDNNVLKLFEASGNGSNSVSLQAPATLSSDVTLTLPSTDGGSGEFLTTDGSGVLSFTAVSLSTANEVTDPGRWYLLIADDADADDGSISTISYSDNKLEFQPSSGTLYCTAVSATDLTASGDLNAGTITETSSFLLKENINPLSSALDKILQLQGVNYNRKKTGVYEAGLIAEEVEKIIPEVVLDEGVKSVAYTRLTAYLVECIKDLKKEIDDLKGK